MRRLVIVLADGLRPDAVSPGVMPSLDALGGAFTVALHARTVRPSATVAALASLATGVGPATHRLIEPGLGFLPRLGAIRPVAQTLKHAGIPSDIVAAELGPGALPVAWALASTVGARKLVAKGSHARETAAADLTARHPGHGAVVVRRRRTRGLRGAAASRGVRRRAECGCGAGMMRRLTHLGGARG